MPAPAVAFDVALRPADGGGVARAAPALRAALLDAFVARTEAGALVDQVFLASVRDRHTGAVALFNASAPENTAGNALLDIDALMTFLAGPGGVRAGGARAARAVRGGVGAGAARRAAGGAVLTLAAGVASSPPDPAATGVIATFNVVLRNGEGTRALMAALRAAAVAMAARTAAASGGGSLAGLALAAALGAPLGSNVSALIDAASVRAVVLTFTRSRWEVVLAWLLRSVAVVVGAGAAAALALVLILCARSAVARSTAARARSRVAARAARVEAFLAARAARAARARAAHAARWAIVRARIGRVLRKIASESAARAGAHKGVDSAAHAPLIKAPAAAPWVDSLDEATAPFTTGTTPGRISPPALVVAGAGDNVGDDALALHAPRAKAVRAPALLGAAAAERASGTKHAPAPAAVPARVPEEVKVAARAKLGGLAERMRSVQEAHALPSV